MENAKIMRLKGQQVDQESYVSQAQSGQHKLLYF